MNPRAFVLLLILTLASFAVGFESRHALAAQGYFDQPHRFRDLLVDVYRRDSPVRMMVTGFAAGSALLIVWIFLTGGYLRRRSRKSWWE